MYLLTLLIAWTPASFARMAAPDCTVELSAPAPVALSAYARWLLQDGLVSPTARLEDHLDELRRLRDPGPAVSVEGLIHSADHRLSLFDRTKHISYRLNELSRGYRALEIRCARVADELRRHDAVVRALVARSDSVLVSLDADLRLRSGVDVDWTVGNLHRARGTIDDFRRRCLDRLPPAETGVMNALTRFLFP